MTTINDALAGCYAPPSTYFGDEDVVERRRSYERGYLSRPINAALKDSAEKHKGWLYFVGLCRRKAGYLAMDAAVNLHPDEIKAVCAMFDLQTVEQVSVWVDANGNIDANALFDCIEIAAPVLPSLRQTTLAEIIPRIQAATNMAFSPDLEFRMRDYQYQMLNDDALDIIVDAYPTGMFKYALESNDCDDACFQVIAQLGRWGIGNAAIFFVQLDMLDAQGNGLNPGHYALLCVTETRVVIWDPQTKEHDLDSRYALGNQLAVSNRIVRIM